MNFIHDILSNKTRAKQAMEQDLEGRVPSFKESSHHQNMRERLAKEEQEVGGGYDKYFALLSDYQGKQLTAAIQQGTRFNIGTNVPWVKREKLPFPSTFTVYYFIQGGALFAECSSQIAFCEWIELPKAKASAQQVLQLQSGLHSIGHVRALLTDIWAAEAA